MDRGSPATICLRLACSTTDDKQLRELGAHLCSYWKLAAMNLTEANRILRLSDSQLAIVRQAAVPLSPSARVRYLKTVAAELARRARIYANWGKTP